MNRRLFFKMFLTGAIGLLIKPIRWINDKMNIVFERIVFPKFTKDVGRLATFNIDIRDILTSNAIKDMGTHISKRN